MKLAVFSAKTYDKQHIEAVQRARYPSYEIEYHGFSLSEETVSLAKDCQAVCVFVNDLLDANVLTTLWGYGVRSILLRCAGFDHVDLSKAEQLGFFVAHVPAYSPESVAEFALALLQTLNRKTHRAYLRAREANFSLDGLTGCTLHGKTVGIIGTGKIGLAMTRILHGFGCKLLAYDPMPNKEFEKYGQFVSLSELLQQSHIISLHCPLSKNTRYMINEETISKMKQGALLVNTSRGGLIDTKAVIAGLKTRKIGGLALDVYEGEKALFYDDHSTEIIEDDEIMRLMTFPNVLVCGHQAFLTEEALDEIAEVTLRNLDDFLTSGRSANALVQGKDIVVEPDFQPVRI